MGIGAEEGLGVEASLTFLDEAGGVAAGLSCDEDPSHGYRFSVSTDGRWAITEMLSSEPADTSVMREGTIGIQPGSTVRLKFECIKYAPAFTSLTASVDGRSVVSGIRVPYDGTPYMHGVGVWVGADEAPAVVLFNELKVVGL